jgi:hypothetical protein
MLDERESIHHDSSGRIALRSSVSSVVKFLNYSTAETERITEEQCRFSESNARREGISGRDHSIMTLVLLFVRLDTSFFS